MTTDLEKEREAFEAWARNNISIRSTIRNDDGEYYWESTRLVWKGWQARAALAQEQASEKAEKYCDDHCTWLDHDPECVIGGKAAPSDEEIDAVAASMPDGVGGMLKQWGYRQFARALLERYGKDGK